MGKGVKSAEDFIEIFTESAVMLQKIINEEVLSIKNKVPEKNSSSSWSLKYRKNYMAKII